MISAENVVFCGWLRAKDPRPVFDMESTVEEDVFDGISNWVCWAAAWADCAVACVWTESVGIVGMEAVAGGELDGRRQNTS